MTDFVIMFFSCAVANLIMLVLKWWLERERH